MPDHNQKSSGIVPEKKNKITVDKRSCVKIFIEADSFYEKYHAAAFVNCYFILFFQEQFLKISDYRLALPAIL